MDALSVISEALADNEAISITPYTMENDPIKAAREKKTEKKRLLSFKKIKHEEKVTPENNSAKAKPEKKQGADKPTEKKNEKPSVSFEGLNELETSVLKFILDHGPVSIDGMASLNIPVSKLLATVTMLEIKKKISQKPGGYFEIM